MICETSKGPLEAAEPSSTREQSPELVRIRGLPASPRNMELQEYRVKGSERQRKWKLLYWDLGIQGWGRSKTLVTKTLICACGSLMQPRGTFRNEMKHEDLVKTYYDIMLEWTQNCPSQEGHARTQCLLQQPKKAS